jgi:hypothetical protein
MASVAEVSKGHACQIEQAQPELQSDKDDGEIENDGQYLWLRCSWVSVQPAGSSSHAVSMAVLQQELDSLQQVGILRLP